MLLLSAVILLAFAVVQWVISLAARDAASPILLEAGYLVCVAGLRTVDRSRRTGAAAGLVFLWGARLAIYITKQLGGARTTAIARCAHTAPLVDQLFTVFLLQGFLTWFAAIDPR